MTVPHRPGCDCLIHRNNAHPDGCIPGYGPSADCPTHPPTARDSVAVRLGEFALEPTAYQRACFDAAGRIREVVEA